MGKRFANNFLRAPLACLGSREAAVQLWNSQKTYYMTSAVGGGDVPEKQMEVHYPLSGRYAGFVKCFLRVPQLYCSFPAALASRGNSQKIDNKIHRNDLMEDSVREVV